MPPSAPQKSYITQDHVKLVDPLPQPAINQSTGLTCPKCPAQLKYVQPFVRSRTQAQLAHLIAWRCPSKTHKLYFCNLTRSLLLEDIKKCNLHSNSSRPDMNMNNLLNPTGGTQPRQNQASSTSCPGLPNSEIGPKHREGIPKNVKCTYQLCLSCCNQLHKSHPESHCVIPGHRSDLTQTTSSKPRPNVIENFVPYRSAQPLQSSQANREITALASSSVLEQIHRNQVDHKIKSIRMSEAETRASRTVIVEFWTSASNRLISQFEAKNWPLCALSESPTLQSQGESTGLSTWNTKLWIWMANLKSWVNTPLDFVVQYPKQPRKIDEPLETSLKNWPGDSMLQDALNWYNSVRPTLDHKAAWISQFGKVWLAGKTSIYRHYKFIEIVTPAKLDEILRKQPATSLRQARKLHPKEWQVARSDNKHQDDEDSTGLSSRPLKRFKTEVPQASHIESDSEIEIVH
ncbi:uncharacterized protein MELLADRAFT_108069 [Melampsora larici-populina 98AG31]|uniref:Uncharacterized protein n=1 Tax=Melampsora larici-populina (strain 98AG31 / pathotype 3-4-7) TaxID=747676 RepID=F4RRV3_MELLP|nr:uncharacterized protein MELLADRAFT_108069 [Melampsora larici-populina 98AG31]EGG04888.1 hypothetical protein MELLADRAFT_108069 [Melampsora larici-populina 98AG31]